MTQQDERAKINRRKFVKIGAGIVAVGAAAGAAYYLSQPGPTPAPTPTSAVTSPITSATPAPTTISFWMHEAVDQSKHYLETVIPGFQTENPHIKIAYQAIPESELHTKYITAFATKTAPDVIGLYAHWAPELWEMGVLEPLDPKVLGYDSVDALVDQYVSPFCLELYKMPDGNVYGLPWEVSNWCMYCNADHYHEAGLEPPTSSPTWDEFHDYAKAMTKFEGGRMVRAGFQWWNLLLGHANNYISILRQLGGDIYSADKSKCTLDSAEAVKALQIYVDTWKDVGGPEFGSPFPSEDFARGKVSMWQAGIWAIPQYVIYESKVNWHVVQYPHVKGGKRVSPYFTGGWFVNKQSQHKREAMEFIRYCSERPKLWFSSQYFCNYTGRKGVAEDPEVRKTAQGKWVDVFMDDLSYTRAPVVHVNAEELEAAIGRAVDRVVSKGTDPADSLKTATDEIDRIIKG